MNGGWQNDDWDWTPASGSRGESYTPELQTKATGVFWRNRAERTGSVPEQRSMMRIGSYVMVGAAGFVVLAASLSVIL